MHARILPPYDHGTTVAERDSLTERSRMVRRGCSVITACWRSSSCSSSPSTLEAAGLREVGVRQHDPAQELGVVAPAVEVAHLEEEVVPVLVPEPGGAGASVGCDIHIHTHAPAPKSSADFILYPVVPRTCSTNHFGHGHGYECHRPEQKAERGGEGAKQKARGYGQEDEGANGGRKAGGRGHETLSGRRQGDGVGRKQHQERGCGRTTLGSPRLRSMTIAMP